MVSFHPATSVPRGEYKSTKLTADRPLQLQGASAVLDSVALGTKEIGHDSFVDSRPGRPAQVPTMPCVNQDLRSRALPISVRFELDLILEGDVRFVTGLFLVICLSPFRFETMSGS